MFELNPAVFAVGKEYQIMIPVECETTMWVRIGDRTYYDASNGVLRSNSFVHNVTVPMEVLDEAGAYTIYLCELMERKPYFTEAKEPEAKEFSFRPVKGLGARAYHLADTHNSVAEPVVAVRAYGDIDFLILNGDIPDHCGREQNVLNIFRLVSALTGGNIPTVFSRGNHDMRGKYAERFADYTPCQNGNSYYTFRLGSLWGLILDCGEDKPDGNVEYGPTICCHDFRMRQTEFIKQVIANASQEYEAEDVEYRMVICHNPFTKRYQAPFNIEEDTYAEWTALLREYIKPQVILSGHLHKTVIFEPGCEEDAYGQPCSVVVGNNKQVDKETGTVYYVGAGLEFTKAGLEVTFTDSQGQRQNSVLV